MPCLSKTARPQISAILPLVSPEQTISPFLQRCSTPPCPNLPVLLSRLCRFQNRTEFRPIRRRCPPDTGRQRRLFFLFLLRHSVWIYVDGNPVADKLGCIRFEKSRQKVEIIFNFVDEVEIPVLTEPMIAESSLGRRKTA